MTCASGSPAIHGIVVVRCRSRGSACSGCDHWNFDREVSRGYLIVNAGHARPMLRVMRRLFELRFAIRRMRLVDAYGSNDRRSMRADNTSAFNCREVSGQPGVWSQHAYGLAIDVNTVENPYVSGSYVSPPNGRPFADEATSPQGDDHPRRLAATCRRTRPSPIPATRGRLRVRRHRLGVGRELVGHQGLPALLGHRFLAHPERRPPVEAPGLSWPELLPAAHRALR